MIKMQNNLFQKFLWKAVKVIMPSKLLQNDLFSKIKQNQKGLISVFGAFLLQLCVGSYHGTFGNLLPYLTSYLRKVNNPLEHFKWCFLRKVFESFLVEKGQLNLC